VILLDIYIFTFLREQCMTKINFIMFCFYLPFSWLCNWDIYSL